LGFPWRLWHRWNDFQVRLLKSCITKLCPRISAPSNPSLNYQGTPTGHSQNFSWGGAIQDFNFSACRVSREGIRFEKHAFYVLGAKPPKNF
jgi:hypothetical protein